MAYKLSASDVAVTRLRGIDVQVGRTGALTPVAVLDPVRIGGVTVTSATLHNADQIEALDLRLGDWVRLERAGGVIPAVLGVDQGGARRDGTETPWAFPTVCPACGARWGETLAEAITRCASATCPAQVSARIRHFVGRGAVDITGLGTNWVDRFLAEGFSQLSPPISTTSPGSSCSPWKARDGGGAGGQAPGLDRGRAPADALARFLFGLGIRHVGLETAEMIAPLIGSLDALRAGLRESEQGGARGAKAAEEAGTPDGTPYVVRLQAEILETEGAWARRPTRSLAPCATPPPWGSSTASPPGACPHPRRPPAPGTGPCRPAPWRGRPSSSPGPSASPREAVGPQIEAPRARSPTPSPGHHLRHRRRPPRRLQDQGRARSTASPWWKGAALLPPADRAPAGQAQKLSPGRAKASRA